MLIPIPMPNDGFSLDPTLLGQAQHPCQVYATCPVQNRLGCSLAPLSDACNMPCTEPTRLLALYSRCMPHAMYRAENTPHAPGDRVAV